MTMAGKKAWALGFVATTLMVALGVSGCGNNNNGVTPGPTPIAGSEFVFVPDAVNNILNVLVIGPDGSFNNGPVPLLGTGAEPVWAAVSPNNQLVYVTNFNGNSVSAFTLNTTSGAMAAVGGSPFPAGCRYQWLRYGREDQSGRRGEVGGRRRIPPDEVQAEGRELPVRGGGEGRRRIRLQVHRTRRQGIHRTYEGHEGRG